MKKKYSIKDYDFRLVILILAITVIGIAVIGSADASVQNKQIFGMGLGIVSMIVVSLIDYNFILKFRWIYYVADIMLLISVLLWGVERNYAKRWIVLFGIQFQPSELSKIVLILFFAGFFYKHKEKLNTTKILLISMVLAALPLVLVLKEDLSTTITTALIFITLLFIAGLSYKIVLIVLGISIPSFAVGIYVILQGKLLQGYQLRRIQAWLYPEEYPDDALQQQNSIMAFASGRLWGKGLYNEGADSVKNGGFISEPRTDFIMAVAGEELGFVGAAVIVLLLLLIALECTLIAIRANDLSGRLIGCGMSALIAFQTLINVSVVTGLLPNTGLPLPFVSYGLTSLVTLYTGMGIVLNVGLQRKKPGRG
ncbi:MAG: FtsW/RodA/SpoVE family cell cycle protein [Lachnospiraceae bacterium]|nr:FtsW/RodA/SpoVE family cell cycle protein [Lachnospiraceae bacterium]